MDITSLMSALTAANTVSAVSEKSGASTRDVSSVLSAALPLLMNGVSNQAANQNTVSGFTSALAQHAANDTSDVNSFMSNVSMNDGSKILAHLLGADTPNVTSQIAASTGVSQKKTNNILSSVSPLLMSLLGQGTGTTATTSASTTTSLISSLLGNADVIGLAAKLLKNAVSTDTSSASKPASSAKKPASGKKVSVSTTKPGSGKKVSVTSAKPAQEPGIDASDVLNILGNLLK